MPSLSLGPIGWAIIATLVIGSYSATYVKGRVDGKASYQAKLTKQINKAIVTGDKAREEALKKFDAQKDIDDDGFARD